MSKIDTKAWKAFRLGDLFVLERPAARVVREYDEGDMPFVASGMNNNGVSCFVTPLHDTDFEEGHCLTVSPLDGSCFWQPASFLGRGGSGASICILRRAALTEYQGLFVASCVRYALSEAAGYGNLYTGSKLLDAVIFLPAMPDGQPNWAYMDAYMSEVLKKEEVFAEHLASLTAEAVADGHVLDTSVWRAFHLYDVFQIDMGNKFDRGKMPFGDAVNFVGRTGVNNGMNAVCGLVDGVKPYPAGYLTLALGGTLGACFLQNEQFYTSQNVIVLIPPVHASLLALQFVSCVTWNTAAKLYSAFSNELNKHVKTDFVFYLPVTSVGEPDWAWMEYYMQQQMDKAEALVKHLDAVWN